ncbi:MAG TPA: M28 family peptidase [Candidatus Dormibacteraeota bacterium]|jgi:glutaminyl-peptide cyclotransferase|nr:M28 family peptidase [Candidatus Dormibacteraeota bacterium]
MIGRVMLDKLIEVAMVLLCCLSLVACDRDKNTAQAGAQPAPAAEAVAPKLSLPPDSGPVPTIDSNRAMKYVKEIVAYGPRPLGSANHKKVEDYLLAHLKGDTVENDVFTADTPEGKFPVHNVIAKFPGTKDGIVVIASHYDTNYPLRNTSYVGANDGGSSSALLLELANQLRGKTREGYSIWLVWDDAEEAMKPDTETPFMDDSLYGITHLAEKWQADGTLKKMKAFILADMIGDADLNVDRDTNSTPWLEDVVYEAATRLGYQSHFFARTLPGVSDDHIPFVKRGVPSADLIDFDYGYNDVFWHTTQDTVDKLSPKSLEIVGNTILETVGILNRMDPLPPK